ncbi:zinc-ribbon domain-containing protein, partial [Rhodocyclus tenuis]|uniref:zinc-ribbon domain-containing protein n=1 Tax=Rhodocyclus tenuis TaxID=1066 RepID=UPI001906C2C6
MKTRCPACATTFRVTPEQLKARAGKVRCGQCDSVFNALDTLIDELVVLAPLPALATGTPQSLAEIALAAPTAADSASASDEIPVSEPLPGATGDTGLRVEALDFPAADTEEAPLIELAAPPPLHEDDDARETIEVDYPELREDFAFSDSSAPGELIVARTLTAPSDAGTENESEDASSPHAAADGDGDTEPATRSEPATGAGGSDDTPASPPAAP